MLLQLNAKNEKNSADQFLIIFGKPRFGPILGPFGLKILKTRFFNKSLFELDVTLLS